MPNRPAQAALAASLLARQHVNEEDAEFVDCREEVLETYERSYDAQHPVICMAEQPVQLIQETREALPATKQHPQRVDYGSERAGTAAVSTFCEPLGGWRQARVARRRTGRCYLSHYLARKWAVFVKLDDSR